MLLNVVSTHHDNEKMKNNTKAGLNFRTSQIILQNHRFFISLCAKYCFIIVPEEGPVRSENSTRAFMLFFILP